MAGKMIANGPRTITTYERTPRPSDDWRVRKAKLALQDYFVSVGLPRDPVAPDQIGDLWPVWDALA